MTAAADNSKAPAPFGGHLGGTEAIRGVLCVLIVWYHCYLYTQIDVAGPPSRGWQFAYVIDRWQLGLSVFFILSAFLLYRPFAQSVLLGRRRPSFGAYLANRFLRIFPAYWTALAAAAVLGVTVVWIPSHEFGLHLPTLLADAVLVQGLHPSGMQTGVPPSWSLSVEWVFYLLLVLFVMLALRIGGQAETLARRRTALLVPVAILFVVGWIGREAARLTVTSEDPAGVLNTWHGVIARSFPPWADLFAWGMLLAVLRVELEAGRLRLPRGWRLAALGGWLVLSVLTVWGQAKGRIGWYEYNGLMAPLLTLFLAAVVLFTGDRRRDPLMRVLHWRPFVMLGEMSLSIYLIHYPVIVYLLGKGIYRPSGWLAMAFNWAVVIAIVLPLSWLSYRYIELPFMRRKVRTTVAGPPSLDRPAPAVAPQPELARA